ncbi:DUF4135 domain-containing protein [Marinilactibacillus psychrotolerans]|uniref:DUF4135 domain-containing protein n=1 Tax=Marinilactibacillus psychrotolerans TaxID=191770 RepID=UPI00388900C2
MNKIDIINRVYKEYTFSNKNYILDFFYSPIHNYIAQNNINDRRLTDIYIKNIKELNIHLNTLISDSAILYINELYRNSNFASIESMLDNSKIDVMVIDFYEKFPTIWELVDQYIRECIDHYKTIYQLLNNNQKSLQENFSVVLSDLDDIKINKGDRHLNYIPTTEIFFKEKSIYYKNREENYESLFCDIYNYFSARTTSVSFFKVENGYFQERIQQKDCHNEKHFYSDSGVLLFVAYLLGLSDLHEENIIFNGTSYVPIDCETIFSNEKYFESDQPEIAYNLRNSILSTGLIPFKSINSAVISGLNSFSSQTIKSSNYEIKIIDGLIKKVAVNEELLKKKKNIPTNYENMDFLTNITLLKKEFRKVYVHFLENKSYFIKKITHLLQNKYSRVLHQNTGYYYELLRRSYHPYLFLSESRKDFFDSNEALLPLEREQLLNDYIPIDKKKIDINSSFFEKFTFEDLNLQLSILHQSFIAERGFYIKKYHPNIKKYYSIEDLNTKFLKLLNDTIPYYNEEPIILDHLFTGNSEDGHEFEVIILPKEYYLGNSGVLLFLHNNLVNNSLSNFPFEKYDLLYKDLLNYVDKRKYNINLKLGYHDGIAGILYTLFKLKNSTTEKVSEDYIIDISYLIIKNYINSNIKSDETDLVNGVIGFLYYLCQIYYNISEENKSKVKEIIDILVQNIKNRSFVDVSDIYFGFAHGIAGVIFVFNQVKTICENSEINKITEKLYKYLNSNYISEICNWKISTKDDKKPINWCHGSPGVLLAYLHPCNNISLSESEKIYSDIISNTGHNLCLCHGIVGNYHILNYVNYYYLNNQILQNRINYIISQNTKNLYDEKNLYEYSKSYMVGLSGILDIMHHKRPLNELF